MEIDGYLDRIAERVRSWRAAEGLTLQQVATRSAVAASTIQKVERQQMVPTVAVLFKIAHGLGKSPADLVDDRQGSPDVVHRRAVDHDGLPKCGTRHLTGQLADAQLSLWRVVHSPGEGAEARHLAPRGEVVMFCERGRLEVTSGGQLFVLEPGDSLHCKTRQGLAWCAVGHEPTVFVVVGTSALGLDQVLNGLRFNRVASSSVHA